MPLILAIEPDRRQAAQLSHIAKHRVHADLVLADTTERALDVIGDRVPDLILVPALLSPQDDAALAAALRVIAAASNVRTLTIPVFASGVKHESGGGLLGRWRRGKSERATDGCDPAVFADQIAEYLKSVAAERSWDLAKDEPIGPPKVARKTARPAAAVLRAVTSKPQPQTEPAVEWAVEMPVEAAVETPVVAAVEMPVVAAVEMPVAAGVETPVVAAVETLVEAAVETPVVAAVELRDLTPAEPAEAVEATDDVHESSVDMALATLEDGEIEIDLSDESLSEIDEPDADIEEEPSVFELSLEDAGDMLFDEPTLKAPVALAAAPTTPTASAAIKEAVAPDSTDTAEEPGTQFPDIFSFEDFVVEPAPRRPIEHQVPMSCGLGRQWPPMYGALADFASALAEMDGVANLNAPAQPAATPEHTEWSALIASLRQDIERLHKAGSTKPTPQPERKIAPAPAPLRPSKKPQRPPQDEWGFFDPAQCGFAALLAKLDEITETGDDSEARRVN